MLSNTLDSRGYLQDTAEPSGSSAYWDAREYYRTEGKLPHNLYATLLLVGSGLHGYLFSIIDSGGSASDDFLRPTYAEISVGGFGNLTATRQTEDSVATFPYLTELNDAVTGGISSLYPGGYLHVGFQRRKIYGAFDLGFTTKPILLSFLSCYRFRLSDRIYLGPGAGMLANLSAPADADLSGGTDSMKPLPGT
jgi:hypothetical protein